MNPRTWMDNPVFHRECTLLRRGKLPIFLFIGGPIVLGLIYFFHYTTFTLGSLFDPSQTYHGRKIFGMLSSVLFWGLLLFVPAIVGVSINKDQQAGALSALRMSRLSTWQILLGKCSAFATFFVLFYSVFTPILSLCLLLGGVSISECFGMFFLTLATALQCSLFAVASGLLFKRSQSVMIGGFLFSLIYLLGIPLGLDLLQTLADYLQLPSALEKWIDILGSWIQHWEHYLFPMAAIQQVFAPGAMPSVNFLSLQFPFWIVSLGTIGVTSLLTLVLAEFLLRMELWLRPKRTSGIRFSKGILQNYHVDHLLDESHNPFLNWEWRRHPVVQRKRWYLWGGGILGIGIVSLFQYLFQTQNEDFFLTLGYMYLGFTYLWCMLIPIFYCSQTIVKEKEMGTFDSLLLTLLQPKQIIESKIKCCYIYVLPVLAIAALICFLGHFVPHEFQPFIGIAQFTFVWLGFQCVRVLYYGMLATYFSFLCQSTLKALIYTLIASVLISILTGLFQTIFMCCGGAVLSFGLMGVFPSEDIFHGWLGTLVGFYLWLLKRICG